MKKYIISLLIVAFFLSASFSPINAQIPDKFENLKVLPKDITKPELMNKMKSFTAALDLRCYNCHVGDPAVGFSSFDFASDDKPLKNKARFMLTMVNSINNEQMIRFDTASSDKRIQVECVTCHRGQTKPVLIGDALMTAYSSGGIDTLVGEYNNLRKRYYGSHTYDFDEGVLSRIGGTLESLGDVSGAIQVLKINIEYFPESPNNYAQIAFAYLGTADTTMAIKNLETAIELAPNVPWFKMQLGKLKGE